MSYSEGEILKSLGDKQWSQQFLAHLHRIAILFYYSNWRPLDFIRDVSLSLIIGLIFLNMPYKEDYIYDRIAALFFITISAAASPLQQNTVFLVDQSRIVRKELQGGLYRLSTYFIAFSIVTVIGTAVNTSCYVVIPYWMVSC